MTEYKKLTDEELIRRLRMGETGIIDYLMEKYKNLVRKEANAMYLLGGETDDLIQEGMIGLFKAVQDYDVDQEASFFSFARLCVTRQLYSAIEASNRKKHSPLNSYISLYEREDGEGSLIDMMESEHETNPEELLVSQEHAKSLEERLEKDLSELERRVLYLHLMGTDYKTIAKLLDRSPKTIDNDLCGIDHCPGFGSAAKYISTVFCELEQEITVYEPKNVIIVEMMGRHAGWLTAAAALAEGKNGNVPYLVYLEEKPFSLDRFIDDVKEKLASTNAVLVAVSEGVHDTEGRFLCEQEESRELDVFGHTKLSGTGKILEEAVRAKIGCKVRSIELNLLQRCAGHILSKTDIEESGNLGANAVKLAVAGESGLMSSLTRVSDAPYTVEYSGVDIREVANKEKKIPVEWINEAGNGVKEELITYLTPLVQGEVSSIYEVCQVIFF